MHRSHCESLVLRGRIDVSRIPIEWLLSRSTSRVSAETTTGEYSSEVVWESSRLRAPWRAAGVRKRGRERTDLGSLSLSVDWLVERKVTRSW